MAEILFRVDNLKKHYPIRKGFFNKQVGTRYVVDGVDLLIKAGETVALIGESGCGKTVLLRTLVGIEEATDGEIYFYGKNVKDMSKQELRLMHQRAQLIFQDSMSALHPRFTIMESMAEPLILSGMTDKKEIERIVVETLEKVGLDAAYRFRNPDSLSGGQRQRVIIARALVVRPDLLFADEPISALDVSLQAQVLNLLMDLQEEFELAMLFVAHDLAVVRQIADYILIMYAGRILEAAPSQDIYDNACHPYTRVLLESAPSIAKGVREEPFNLNLKIGDAPDPAKLPGGCVFHTRCIYADEKCQTQVPPKRDVSRGHYVCCHKYEEIRSRRSSLAGSPEP